MGTVYLLHFEEKLSHAQHYLGYTDDIEQRLERHRSGNGARIVEVITQLGINFKLVRTWKGNRKLERKLKKHKNAPKKCPICSAKAA